MAMAPALAFVYPETTLLSPILETTRAHRETTLDLDPDRVENAANTSLLLGTGGAVLQSDTPCIHGLAKSARYRSVVHPAAADGSVVGEFGQDRVYTHEVHGTREGRPFSVHIAACADGHGSHGEVVSREVLDGLHSCMTPDLLGTLLVDPLFSGGDVHKPMEDLYRDLDTRTAEHVHDGTTLSLLLVFAYEGRVVLLASNVGDSPILLVHNETGKVTRLHGEHTWESLEERRINLEASRAAGRRDATVIYARFNCANGRPFRDPNGGNEVLPMFREGTDEVLVETRRHVIRESKRVGWVGGTQSLRRFKFLRLNEATQVWEQEALEEHGHDNFGSTPLWRNESGSPMGGCQMTRGLGDHFFKGAATSTNIPLVLCRPSVTVREMQAGDDISFVVCSDGIGDAFYWHQIGDVFRANRDATTKEAADALLRETFVRGGGLRLPQGQRTWDDLSMVVGRLRVTP